MLISKPTNDGKTYSWNTSTMQKQETSTWMQIPFYNLFLDLESIGNKNAKRMPYPPGMQPCRKIKILITKTI